MEATRASIETDSRALSPSEQHDSELDRLLHQVARLSGGIPVAPEPDRTGDRIAHFQLRSRIGSGGMGIVYRAEDLKLRRVVALKVLPAALVSHPGRRRRFLREARSASAVLHANLATVFEVGDSDGTVFIAMEHVEGVTLRALQASRGGRLGVAESLSIACSIAAGVGKAHSRGVVHRDLKPDNVMVTHEGDVKVLDFGLAKLVEDAEPANDLESLRRGDDDLASHVGTILGTPAYMSPEQAAGQSVDARSDVFSVGVMIYEMVSGKRPFQGADTRDLLAAVKHEEPLPLDRVNPETPRALAAIVRRCLSKRPDDRFEDCAELRVALAAVAQPSPPTSPRAAIGGRTLLLVTSLLALGGIAAMRRAAAPARSSEPVARSTASNVNPSLAVADAASAPRGVEAAQELPAAEERARHAPGPKAAPSARRGPLVGGDHQTPARGPLVGGDPQTPSPQATVSPDARSARPAVPVPVTTSSAPVVAEGVGTQVDLGF